MNSLIRIPFAKQTSLIFFLFSLFRVPHGRLNFPSASDISEWFTYKELLLPPKLPKFCEFFANTIGEPWKNGFGFELNDVGCVLALSCDWWKVLWEYREKCETFFCFALMSDCFCFRDILRNVNNENSNFVVKLLKQFKLYRSKYFS